MKKLLIPIIICGLILGGCADKGPSKWDKYVLAKDQARTENTKLIITFLEKQTAIDAIAIQNASPDARLLYAYQIRERNENIMKMALVTHVEKPTELNDVLVATAGPLIEGILRLTGWYIVADFGKEVVKNMKGDNYVLTNSNQNDIGNMTSIKGDGNFFTSSPSYTPLMPEVETLEIEE